MAKIEALRRLLRGDFSAGGHQAQDLSLLRSLPHGHVAAALGTLRWVAGNNRGKCRWRSP
jgi:hypothetical protein